MVRMIGRKAEPLRGNYAGREGRICHQVSAHPLAPNKRRWAIWFYHPQARMIFMQEDGFIVRI